MLEVYKSSNEADFRKDLKLFDMPTLIIHGEADYSLLRQPPPNGFIGRYQRVN